MTSRRPMSVATTPGAATASRVSRWGALAAVLLLALWTASGRLYAQQTCPCTIWPASTTVGPMANDASGVELGVKFQADADGFITGLRFYKYAQNTGTHIGNLWASNGTLLGTVTFAGETASGWQEAAFPTPIAVTANTTYIASYYTPTGFYAYTGGGFAATVDNAPLHALATGTSPNGVYRYGGASGFPNQTYQASNYWVDVVYTTAAPPDTTPPTVTGTTPVDGATGIADGVSPAVSFSEAMDPATVTGATVELRDASSVLVPATVTYDPVGHLAFIDPDATLGSSAAYTATVKGGAAGVKDLAGNALAADMHWSFATASAGGCPCSIWPEPPSPGAQAADGSGVELGVKFQSEVSGLISGVRFYKYSENNGPHAANLWTSGGTLLGTATFANESASGWQEASFNPPVAIDANTTYVASYYTPSGHYAITSGGLTAPVDNAPLHAFASSLSGGNGVYRYGGSSAFPNQTFQDSNYWVDVVFTPAGPDATPPTVAVTAPLAGASVSGAAVALAATASDNLSVAGIQFKVDGVNVGVEDTVAPYTATWDTGALVNGLHTVTAVARDGANNSATSAPIVVTVNNVDTTPPTVSLTAPAGGATVSGIAATVSATAADNLAVVAVQFLLDGVATGSEVTSPPYAVAWNTTLTSNGPHTLAARARDAAGNQTTSAPVSVTVSNLQATTLAIDATAFGDRSGSSSTVTTSAFSTTSTKELLLAFISADDRSSGQTVSNVTGGGLSWALVVRTNAQRGTAEVWRAFAASTLTNVTVQATLAQSASASLTVVSFSGADYTGASGDAAIGAIKSASAGSGAPTGTLTTTRNNSWVFGVGNDWDHATARTVGSGQTLVHQYLATVGDTYWVQRRTATTPTAGTSVTINDTAPTGDRYNLSLVEVLPFVPDTTAPAVASTNPPAGATGVSVATIVTATFSEHVDPATINGTTVQLRDAGNSVVPAVVTYDAPSSTASITPTAGLQENTSYTATISTGVTDLAGNPLLDPVAWMFATGTAGGGTGGGAGGPILVIGSPSRPFSRYYAEILRAEGLNEFETVDLSDVSASFLSGYDVAILGEQPLTTTQVSMFTNWVQNGGKLIAMRPDTKLASLLGLSVSGGTLRDAYLLINTAQPPGQGLVNQTIQFHGTADQYVTAGATTVATLYSDATHATAYPAVTMRAVGGNGGQAAAFTYDLARSIVYTRQGNPAWAGQERDDFGPIRPDDLYFGAKSGDVQPDWVDLTKVQIPQADEQQRLLANLVLQLTQKPWPRFWYFPRGKKAVVIMTGDDHANGGTAGRFDEYIADSAPGCNVDDWECVRSTSYIYPWTPLTNAQAMAYEAQGFEISVHPNPNCVDWTPSSLANTMNSDLTNWRINFPGLAAPQTERTHCLVWSDWSSHATVGLSFGFRLDLNYYYWPPSWILDQPGLFTGSGIPMRFAASDGSLIDVFQATTQMTDESGQTYPKTINTLLDNAVGSKGYYGAFAANMHTDMAASAGSDAIVAAAQARGVPVVSAQQMLTWLDGRTNSVFGPIAWNGSVLTFSVVPAAGANGLQVMIPTQAGSRHLLSLTLNGAPVSWTTQTIKGVSYAFVTVSPGQYRATFN